MNRLFLILFMGLLASCSSPDRCGPVGLGGMSDQEKYRAFFRYIEKQGYEVAQCILQKIKAEHPSRNHYREDALVYAANGDKEKAFESLDELKAVDPRPYSAYLRVSKIFDSEGDHAAARNLLHDAITIIEDGVVPEVDTYSPVEEEIFLMLSRLHEDSEDKKRILEKGKKYVSLSDKIDERLESLR
jgi:tetratricopeptide (TPR) repeat protein